MALKKRDSEIIAHILNADKDTLSHRDLRGRTPLHIAAYKTLLPIVEIFLEQGADITVRDNDNKTSLDLAKERLQWTESLYPPSIHRGAAFFRKNQKQFSTQIPKPWPYKPCKSNDFQKIVTLLTAKLDQQLRTAIKIENKEEVIKLLNNGANSNWQDLHGDTPLHLAINQTITKKSKDIIWGLLFRGADPTITNNSGQTAIHLVANKKSILWEIFPLLTSKKESL